MENGTWLDRPPSIIDDHIERRYAAVIARAFRHALCDWNIPRGAAADRRPQGRDQQVPHKKVLSRFAEHVSTSKTTGNRTRYSPQGIPSRSSTEALRYCWKREDSTASLWTHRFGPHERFVRRSRDSVSRFSMSADLALICATDPGALASS